MDGSPRRGSPLEPVTADPDEHNFQEELPRSNFADLRVDKDLILQTAYSEDRIHFKLMHL